MNKRILLIDDDEELCNEMAEILTDEGFSVQTAYNGLDGKSLIQHSSFDIILLDYRMPGLNGIDILKFIKKKIS